MAKPASNTQDTPEAAPVVDPVEKRSPADLLTEATLTWFVSKDDNRDAVLAITYAAIHASQRADAMTVAQLSLMGQKGITIPTIGLWVDVLNHAPKAVASARTTKVVPLTTDQRAAVIRVAIRTIGVLFDDVVFQSHDADADATVAAGHEATVQRVTEKLIHYTQTMAFGGKAQIDVDLPDLVASNTVPAGATLTGPNNAVAKVIDGDGEHGHVQYNGKQYDSLSAAARAAAGCSSNGWTFWTYNGKKVGSYRLTPTA